MSRILLRPRKACTAECKALSAADGLIHKFVVSALVQQRILIVQLIARAPVGAVRLGVEQELAAVRLESGHVHLLCQISALFKPPAPGLRIREVRHQGIAEPHLGYPVWAAVAVFYAEPVLNGVFFVKVQLSAVLRPLILDDRYLPQHEPHSGLFQLVCKGHRVRPFSVPAEAEVLVPERPAVLTRLVLGVVPYVERLLIAPGLEHHHRRRYRGLAHPVKLFLGLGLRIPAVRRHPRPERPFRGERGIPRLFRVCPYQLGGRPLVDHGLVYDVSLRAAAGDIRGEQLPV